MEKDKLMKIADLMSQQSGEEVEAASIIKLPDCPNPDQQWTDRYEAYVARAVNCTCLVHCYADGRIHVYVH